MPSPTLRGEFERAERMVDRAVAAERQVQVLKAELEGWEAWSNELAMVLPDDAETWPGVNPDAAQEAIIVAALEHLLKSREKLIQLAKQIQYRDGGFPWVGDRLVEILGVEL